MDQIGSDMLVDDDFDEKQHVAIITPDTDDQMDDVDPHAEPEPRADEYDAFLKKHMPESEENETEDQVYNTWEIKDWRTLTRREHGPVFECAGHPWRVLFFPYGNNVDFASFYLEQGYEEKQMPEDWYACVQFMLVLWNPKDPSMYLTHTAHHRFTAEEGDWGFTRFAELRRLFSNSWDDRGRPMVEDNTANVTAYIRVLKDPTGVLWHNFINYDSKKETGMVGLKNQGATCYLNSLLQSLFFTNAFRQAVYQIPTAEESDRSNSAYALQRLFYLLQTQSSAVGTTDLTQSFGWDSKQIFEQQDVQELSRVLMDKLDEKMKGTEAEGALTRMFVGKMKTYISCINVDYESSRIEDFWDIQLNVSGNKNLDDSFKDYIQVETMDGENKYFAEGFGLQDAKKGVIFESFPPVLHLQLKRFEYDFQRDAMMKVNDRYEFPEIWDAAPYLSEGADRSESWIYHLHGVLVHSGDLNAGHYYAFLKPTKDGHYYKFDDDRVTRATLREALEENFGGDYAQANGNTGQRNPYTRTWSAKRSMSAYMLVYIRETRLDSVLMDGKSVEPPKHLAERLAEERAAFERRKKEREEAHLYMDVAVASENNFKVYQGFDIVSWKGDADAASSPKIYRILRAKTMAEFAQTVAEDLEVDADMLRPWSMVNRQNGTVRPDTALEFPDMTVEEAANKHGTKQAQFRLWIEKAEKRDENGAPVFGDALVDLKVQQNNRPLMIFLKHFDAKTQSLFGIGTFYAAAQDKVSDLSPAINKLMGWPAGTQIKLSEEIKLNMIEAMKPKVTLAASEIQDGDILTVQRTLSDKEISQITAAGGYVEAKDFYDYLLNRINVEFVPRLPEATELPTFSLTLSKKMAYDQFASKVAEYLKTDPSHLRFTTVSTAGKPKLLIKYNANSTLNNILFPGPYNYSTSATQRPDALFYEVLEMSLKELEQRKPIKVIWLPEGLSKEEEYTLMIPKNAQVSDLLEALQKKANISDETMQKVRAYETNVNKFTKNLTPDHLIATLYDYHQVYVAPFPEDESPKKITVFHFEKEPTKPHGIPFQFSLKEGEPFSETKQRISDFTKIKGKQLDKIKFALVSRPHSSKPEYLDDEEILWDIVGGRDDIALGLDHTNKSKSFWGKSDSIFIR
ncbi:cysteine proteinase [Cucurbitaria berberidis CBS 394.84]|uniref:ubiquitinyl hydrolase 1 n=1 Tax=Cucurbitaria berberidis CBS 394.84 TaxID=1168544 RepID=A0A9P4LB51_9PLEO|nr:cysteine proteinase [Cucurbitaria berberidis CBS 394.84]KAF1848153.1 cysteine proteinase [Cucurbitaria berberidis CBS 394.84]